MAGKKNHTLVTFVKRYGRFKQGQTVLLHNTAAQAQIRSKRAVLADGEEAPKTVTVDSYSPVSQAATKKNKGAKVGAQDRDKFERVPRRTQTKKRRQTQAKPPTRETKPVPAPDSPREVEQEESGASTPEKHSDAGEAKQDSVSGMSDLEIVAAIRSTGYPDAWRYSSRNRRDTLEEALSKARHWEATGEMPDSEED